MENVISLVRRELKRELEAHEVAILKLAYDYGRAEAISRAQSVLPILKRRQAEEVLKA